MRWTRWDLAGYIPYYRVFDRSVRDLSLFYRSHQEGEWKRFREERVVRFRQAIWNPEALPTKTLWANLRCFSDFHALGLEVPEGQLATECIFAMLFAETECETYCQFAVQEDGSVIFAAQREFLSA